MTFARCFVFLLLGLVLAPAPGWAGPFPGFEDAIGLLDAWVSTVVEQRHQPGLSIGVVLGDRLVWSKGYGYSDLERRVPADDKTNYRIASISKTFTAVAILQLRDAEKLQLDDPITRHLEWARIREYHPDARDITIRDLLTHGSGLQRELPGTNFYDLEFPSASALREPLEQIYPSDTAWKYSNLGFELLGEIVATVSGEPWDRYVQRHIMDPLGMATTTPLLRSDDSALAVGYARPAPDSPYAHWPTYRAVIGIGASGAVVSNVDDLAKYLAFHLASTPNESPVLSSSTLREMQRPHWLMDDWQSAWGLGLRVRRVDGRIQVGHGGSLPGYRSQIEFVPAAHLGVIVLANSDDSNAASYADYALQLLAPIVLRTASPEAPPPPPDSARYAGHYRSKNGLVTMVVAVLNGQLSLLSLEPFAAAAANPYLARTILEPTDDPHTFVMRSPGGFSSGGLGERLIFEVGENGDVLGFRGPSSRLARVGDLRPVAARRAPTRDRP